MQFVSAGLESDLVWIISDFVSSTKHRCNVDVLLIKDACVSDFWRLNY